MNLTPVQQAFWNASGLKSTRVYASFAGNQKIADSLIALYLSGKKWAGSGLVRDYETAGDPLPRVGDHWIVLNSKSEPQFILKTVRVERNPFNAVNSEIARAEGEGDLSVEAWRDIHRRFFEPFLEKWGVTDLDSAEVITEFFEIVYHPTARAGDLAKRFATALDRDDFSAAKHVLALDCEYFYNDEVIKGRDQVLSPYETTSKMAKQKFDSVRYESEVESQAGDQATVLFTDHIRKGAAEHTFRCRQQVESRNGQIIKVTHQEIPGERDRLNEFFRQNGIVWGTPKA